MAVTRKYREVFNCDLESELDLAWGEGSIAFCKQNGGKWWKVESNTWVEKSAENPVGSGGSTAWGDISGKPSVYPAALIPTQYTIVAQQAWTNKALALQEFLNTNQRRLSVDMTNATQFRIIAGVTVQGVAASVTGVQYSDDGGTTWRGLDNGTSGVISTVTISDFGTGTKVSAWTNLATGAKADRLIRVVGSGGDGTADPAFSNICIQLK